MSRIVEVRAHIALRKPEPVDRESFKRAVEHELRVAHQKAKVLESVAGSDIDLEPYLENIANDAIAWQRKEFDRRSGDW